MRLTGALCLVFGLLGLATPAPCEPAVAGTFTPKPSSAGLACDLPLDQAIRNTVGTDNRGLCVFTSVEVAARWQNVRALDGFQKWMTGRAGGGWPEKLDRELAEFAREKRVTLPKYIQHTGGDVEFLELAIRTRRMPAVTYSGRDDLYRFSIAHMVNLAHLDREAAAILDNNRPGVAVWMTRAEMLERWDGWAVVLLSAPPPPAPPTSGQCQPVCPVRPIRPLGPEPFPVAVPRNYGIDQAQHRPGGPRRYWLNGVEISRGQAFEELLVDDSAKPHLSIVAGDGDRDLVELALASPRVAALAKLCHVQIVEPDSWIARRLSARVTIQAPAAKGGKVLGTASACTIDDLLALLRRILDPHPEPAPEPHPAPEPSPEPSPITPRPCPKPGPQPDPLVCLIALILAWLGKRPQ